MILTILVAGLAVLGGILLFRAAAEALFETLPEKSFHIFYLQGEEGRVEQNIRSCLKMQERGKLPGKLIFVDDGLSPEAQITARIMLQDAQQSVLCAPSQIQDYIGREKEIIGAGTH